MTALSSPLLRVVFAAGAAATWIAGVFLSRATDALDERWHLGEAFGGMILLAISGSLPARSPPARCSPTGSTSLRATCSAA